MSNYHLGAALTILIASSGVAYADVDATQVTLAYVDGYTGTDGQFHPWEHRSDAESIRAKRADIYRPWRHDDPRHKDDH